MNPAELEKVAYTVECFLNALHLKDGSGRTTVEEWLVRWLAGDTRRKEDCAIYRKANIECHSGGRIIKNFALPEAQEPRTIWCDGRKISTIDGDAYNNGQLVMLGVAGLALTVPGVALAGSARRKEESNCNNNNNNNNNNTNNNG